MILPAKIPKDYQPNPLKLLCEMDKAWEKLCDSDESIRDIEKIEIHKMRLCGTSAMGGKRYHCENKSCKHTKYIYFTCSSRSCLRCGKKATDNWIKTQTERLPDCDWAHITFTMPDDFWPLFQYERGLLNKICKLASDNLLYTAKKRGLLIGIFAAIHTNGRRLTWNTHVHLSATLGGINKHGDWKTINFKLSKVRARWQNNICELMLEAYEDNKNFIHEFYGKRDFDEWKKFVETQRQRHWSVNKAKKRIIIKTRLNISVVILRNHLSLAVNSNTIMVRMRLASNSSTIVQKNTKRKH